MNVERKQVIHASIAATRSADEHARIAGTSMAGSLAYSRVPTMCGFEVDHLRACHADRLEADALFAEFAAMPR